MTSAGPHSDALQQVRGNKGAGHGGSLTMAIPRIAQMWRILVAAMV
jgi:hypothetical protein